jgi:hypothetical protein
MKNINVLVPPLKGLRRKADPPTGGGYGDVLFSISSTQFIINSNAPVTFSNIVYPSNLNTVNPNSFRRCIKNLTFNQNMGHIKQ